MGIVVPLFTWSVLKAANGSFASAQIPLSIWTGGAVLGGFAFRSWFLYRHRETHRLRLLEYPGPLLRPSVLTGGIAYGGMAVFVAFFKGLFAEAELAKLSPPVSIPPGILLGIFPLMIATLAGYLTVGGILRSMPESKDPSKDEKDLQRLWAFITGGWKGSVVLMWRKFRS